MKSRSRAQGFTLIEAAVAIAVVAILSGIIVPLVVKNLRDSQRARALNDIQVIAGAIGSQIKDTGTRPVSAGGPNGSNGATANATWYSGPALTGQPATGWAGVFVAANSFTNLFTAATPAAGGAVQTLFYGAAAAAGHTANTEFAYKGPYMGTPDAAKTDPWGHPYLILGYNVTQQTANGPIWVVSAGPNGAFAGGNANPTPPAAWGTGGNSADDIVMRVN